MSAPRTVVGVVRLVEALPEPGGVLHVRIEDVSRIDAAARVVAEQRIPVDGACAAGAGLPFRLRVPVIDEQAHYAVRVHLQTAGSERIAPGDRISTAAYPVLTHGHPDRAEVLAHQI